MSESPMSAVMTEVPEEVGHEASESSHLGSWVELHEEPCRNGRMRRLLVNHATNTALSLDEAEASLIRSMRRKGFVSGDPNHAELLAELGEGGFLAGDGQPQPRRQELRLSLSDFDLRWDGADRFVHALIAEELATCSTPWPWLPRSSSGCSAPSPLARPSSTTGACTFGCNPLKCRSFSVSAWSPSPSTRPPTRWW